MKLLGEFFKIHSIQVDENTVKAFLELNALHPVFEGHFPGQPVVPGVCMMQMVKEMLETVMARETRLVRSAQMKFLAVINPLVTGIVRMELKYDVKDGGEMGVVATISSDAIVHFKFQGVFSLACPG